MSFKCIHFYKHKHIFKVKIYCYICLIDIYVINLATPLDDSPSLHAKSSPVPIHRPHTISQSGYSMSPKTSPVS